MHETYDAEILPRTGRPAPGLITNPRLGIIGGGQLAKMTAMVGLRLGCDIVVLERSPWSPAANLATHSLVGNWDEPSVLAELAALVDVVTLENEFVAARSLATLERLGCPVFPPPATIALVQDKWVQKQTLAAAGLPVPRCAAVASAEAVGNVAQDFGWPLLLKARRNAYDGKGNTTVRSPEEVPAAWETLGGHQGNELFVEAFCPFTHELAIIITRGRQGEIAAYPVVETVQRNHICHLVRAPAALTPAIAQRAAQLGRQAVAAVGAVGSFGVEMFLTETGELLINELAPRVHNSGHYTLEACACSQFENHVRAVLGWPLGPTAMVAPAAVMVNLLGQGKGGGWPAGMAGALAVPGARVHLYGKAVSGPGRKMGHVTAVGETLEHAAATAQRAANALQFGNSI